MPVNQDPKQELASFARSVLGGKKTSDVKSKITDETKFALQRRCHELDVSESEYVCQLIEVSLFGLRHVQSISQQKLSAVVERFPEGGLQ